MLYTYMSCKAVSTFNSLPFHKTLISPSWSIYRNHHGQYTETIMVNIHHSLIYAVQNSVIPLRIGVSATTTRISWYSFKYAIVSCTSLAGIFFRKGRFKTHNVVEN